MGAWLLGHLRRGRSMDVGLLGRCQGERGGIPARAAGDGRIRSQHSGTLGRSSLAAWLVALAAEPLRMATRLLGSGANRLGLDSGPLRVDTARLSFCRWLLRLLGG